MDRHTVVAALAVAVSAAVAGPTYAAVRPTLEQFLPSVAHASGALPGSEFRTDVWVYNPGVSPAVLTMSFYFRGPNPPSPPAPVILNVAAGEVLELDDVVASQFALTSAVGGMRFSSDQPVTVTARIYDVSVQGTNGTGTAGQFFAATPLQDAIPNGGSTDIVGIRAVKEPGATFAEWRTNVGFMNASADATQVKLTLYLGDGSEYPPTGGTVTDTFTLGAYEPLQLNDVFSQLKRPYATNVRCRLEVLSGGPVIAFGSVLDGRTNDPSTLDMTGVVAGGWDGVWVAKIDKTAYDVPLTLTVADGQITTLDTTVLVTDEDVGPACTGGELLQLAGPIPTPVVPDDLGNFAFSVSGSSGGVGVSLQVAGTFGADGTLTGSVTTTVTGNTPCGGSKTWPLIGARVSR